MDIVSETASDNINLEINKEHKCSSICPSYEYLSQSKIITNVVCTVPNCDEIFSQESALNFHLEKVHKIIQKTKKSDWLITKARSKLQKLSDNCNCKYYCPVDKCKFNLKNNTTSMGKFLPTFHSLKNHFIRMHGTKTFKCSKCYKDFSIKSEMERHESNCGKMFKCSTCNILYATYQSLYKHSKKKNHLIPFERNPASELSPTYKMKLPAFNSINTNNSNNLETSLKPFKNTNQTSMNLANLKQFETPINSLKSQQTSSSVTSSGYQLIFLNCVNSIINQPLILVSPSNNLTKTIANLDQNSPKNTSIYDEIRSSAVACQTTVQNLRTNNNITSYSTQETGSQTVYLGENIDYFQNNNTIPSVNSNQFNLSCSTSPFHFDSLYNTQETQTIIQNLNMVSTTQEVGSQTVYSSQTPLFETSVPTNTQTTSTATSTHFQTEDYCLDAGTSTYLDMYLSDISTQTQSHSLQFNDVQQNLTDNFYYINESNYPSSAIQSTKNLKDTTSNNNFLNNNDRESMITPSTSSIFSNSTCQTENLYFENINSSMNSIQTQTTNNFVFSSNSNNQVVNTKTQTEWGN